MRATVLILLLAAATPLAARAQADPAPVGFQTTPQAAPATPQISTPEPSAAPEPAATPDETALRAMVRREAETVGLPPEVAEAVAEVESSFNPRAVGGVGEIGLMQVLPSTARMLGFRAALPELFVPETNIRYGVRYLGEAWRKTGADICGTVMKYRAGHGETRFSHKSVAYCVRVRAILAARGYQVTGVVPVATFGSAGASPLGRVTRSGGRVRMRFNWRAVDARRRTLDRAGGSSLGILQ